MANEQQGNGTASLLKQTFTEFSEDQGTKSAAALAYYTVFSLPPLLVLLLMIAGFFAGPQQLQGGMQQQMQSLLGPQAAQQVQTMIQSAQQPGQGGMLAMILGVAALLLGATGRSCSCKARSTRCGTSSPIPSRGAFRK